MAIQSRLRCAYLKFKWYAPVCLGLLSLIIFAMHSTLAAASTANTNSDDYQYNSFKDFQAQIDSAMGQNPNVNDSSSSTPTSLSNSTFNISGPLAISTIWSDIYGPIFITKYTGLFNANNAFAIEGDLGTKENRINLTYGHAFSPKNRLKLTIERLAQKQSFDFYSGSVDEWVSQYAGGGEFQHLLGNGFFNNFSIGGYYAKALDKSLDPVSYLDDDGSYYTNYRHIAGATSMGANLSLGLRPWKTGLVTLTSYYDSVHYNNIYSDVSASDSTELGYGIEVKQYLSDLLQTSVGYSSRAIYDTMNASVEFVRNIFHDSAALGVSLTGSHTNYTSSSDEDNNSENTISLGIQYYFAPVKKAYSIPEFTFNSLTSWTSTPAVRMEAVLAAADQSKVAMQFNWNNANLKITPDTSSATLKWTPPDTSTPNDTVSYTLSLKESDGTVIYTNKPITPTNNSYTITDLSVNTDYVATLTASDDHNQSSTTGGNDGSGGFTTIQGTMSFNKPTLTQSGSDSNNDYFDATWSKATLNPTDDSATVRYSYKIVATYSWPNKYDDIPDETKDIDSNNGESNIILSVNDIKVAKQANFGGTYNLSSIKIVVTAFVDTSAGKSQPDYQSTTQQTVLQIAS